MNISGKHTQKIDMEKELIDNDILECSKALEMYGDLAASEAITRALVNERNGKRERAVFWVNVFNNIVNEKSVDNMNYI